MKRSFIRQILEAIDDETISFAGGLPDESLFPIKDLARASKKVLKNAKYFQYTVSTGILPLRQKIAALYNQEGFVTSAENILITTGSQQALYIIAKYFEGNPIVIEKPSYLGAVNIFRMNKMSMEAIALHHEGIDTQAFDTLYPKVKLAYLIPDFQNPKSSRYAQSARDHIAQVVAREGGYIIEDAPYSQLYFDSKQPSISQAIPDNSLHLGSFSKTLTPSLRIGWVRANEEMIAKLTQIKETIDLHSSGISQYILNEYLADKSRYEKHLQTLRESYQKKMEYFAKSLHKILPQFEFQKPQGGMFIYGRLPHIDTKKLVYEALKHKVVYVPGSEFYLSGEVGDEIRFNYTHSSKKEIKEGLRRLKEIV